jgi:hypothetical protein
MPYITVRKGIEAVITPAFNINCERVIPSFVSVLEGVLLEVNKREIFSYKKRMPI